MLPYETNIAFVDEYGDPNLETTKQGTTTYFILTAILVDEKHLDSVRSGVDQIRKTFFGAGEIRSKSVGAKDGRRLQLLSAFQPLPWSFYSLALDKREIRKNGGLVYKQTFRKFAVGGLYKRLFGHFPSITVIVDESGRSEFMAEFKSYLERKFRPNLFARADFRFVSSRDEVLVQLADFVGGTLGRMMDPKKKRASDPDFFELLHPHALGVEEWPPRLRSTNDRASKGRNSEDAIVRERSLFRAVQFLESASDSRDPGQHRQVEVLKYLLYYFNFVSDHGFVSSCRLLEILNALPPGGCSLHELRTKVIAKLRDAGVLIASGPKGYKIPSSVSNVLGFVEHGHTILAPMLSRIEKARTELLVSTENRLDILAAERYAYIREFLDRRRFMVAD